MALPQQFEIISWRASVQLYTRRVLQRLRRSYFSLERLGMSNSRQEVLSHSLTGTCRPFEHLERKIHAGSNLQNKDYHTRSQEMMKGDTCSLVYILKILNCMDLRCNLARKFLSSVNITLLSAPIKFSWTLPGIAILQICINIGSSNSHRSPICIAL